MPTLRSLLLAGFLLTAPAAIAQDTAPLAQPGPTPALFDDPGMVAPYLQTITPDDLAAHLYLFASDEFEGREAATRGQKLAAKYLATQYRRIGLTPAGTMETDDPYAPEQYFQQFDVYSQQMQGATLQVSAKGRTAEAFFGPDAQDGHAYLVLGNQEAVEGDVVFAGYGIADDELGYNDYAALAEAGISTEGKWVLLLGNQPLVDAETSRLPTPDGTPSAWSKNIFQKFRAARTAGMPKGFLIVGDAGPRGEDIAEAARKAAHRLHGVGRLSMDPGSSGRPLPPMYVVSTELANTLLAAAGRTVADVQKAIDADLQPIVMELEGATATSGIQSGSKKLTTENVLAFIEGSDPTLKDEVLVISSHYDHVGIDPTLEGDQIFNGADDDGSGTVATLEIAEAFMQAKRDGRGPRRSILFINVSAEEKGLLGSEYYADHEPVFPLENTVANLNIDMIGRLDPTYEGDQPEHYIYIIGSNLISKELHDLNLRANEVTNIKLDLNERFNSKDDPNRFYARSDHWNFGKHGIPFIFFFNGTHADYHGVDDEPEKIEYEKLAAVTRLIFASAWQIANQDARPAVSGEGFN